MTAPDLLPCPFCGSLKVSPLRHSILQPQPCAMCRDCYASAVSISAWNTRPTPLADAKLSAIRALQAAPDGWDEVMATRALVMAKDSAEAKVAALVEALAAAQTYIEDLEAHEGAEGFSTSTGNLGAAYYAAIAAATVARRLAR